MSALGVLITLLAWVAIIFLVALGSIATVACGYEIRRRFRCRHQEKRAERLAAGRDLVVVVPEEWTAINQDDRTWLAGWEIRA